MQAVADTFHRNATSGAPNTKAMQLIEATLKTQIELYGGAIGFMDFSETQSCHHDPYIPEQKTTNYISGRKSRNCTHLQKKKRCRSV
jgi:hypothetical protein